LKVEDKDFEMPKGAHIVLANHNSMLDFLFVMLAIYPKRLNAVTAQKWFTMKSLHKLLPAMGCIPKNMFDPDIRSIISIKTVLKRGDGILLFPEGRVSTSGAYVGINKATGKMVKKLGVPTVSCYIEGAYTCLPHWRKGLRRGPVRVTFKTLFSVDDAKSMSISEINDAIDARLSGAEGALPVTTPFRTFREKKLAEGLHKILYWCPICDTEYKTESFDNEIRCNACGTSATMDRFANLNPKTANNLAPKRSSTSPNPPHTAFPSSIQEWFKKQIRHEQDSLAEDMEPLTECVIVKMPSETSGGGMVVKGEGVVKLDPQGWHFDGELSGEKVNLFFPIETIPAMSYNHNEDFQIYSNGKFYMFVPENKQKSLKYVILAECMHWKFSSITQMTPGNAGYV